MQLGTRAMRREQCGPTHDRTLDSDHRHRGALEFVKIAFGCALDQQAVATIAGFARCTYSSVVTPSSPAVVATSLETVFHVEFHPPQSEAGRYGKEKTGSARAHSLRVVVSRMRCAV